MLRKIFLGLFATAMVLVIVYMLGPKVSRQDLVIQYPEVPSRLSELSKYVSTREDTVIGLKSGNEAYIQWADSSNKAKTPYSIVYIHGFGASPMDCCCAMTDLQHCGPTGRLQVAPRCSSSRRGWVCRSKRYSKTVPAC
jgi:hypothetical protein